MKPIILAFFITVQLVHAAAVSTDLTLRDAARGRDIECRVYFPEAGTALPLIVFSHGFGADRTAFEVIARHWAEHGYVVVLPSHLDGFGKSAGKSLPQQPGAALKPLAAKRSLVELISDPAKTEARVEDVVFIMGNGEQISAKIPALAGRLDTKRIGVSGHSFGAYIASLLGGVTVDLGGQKARSFRDARVRCILPISAQGAGQQGLTESSWNQLKIPMMTITGSRDRGAGGQGPDWKKQPFRYSPPGDKYLVDIEGANHVSFGGYGGRDNAFTPVVKATTLAFWDAYLKGEASAKAALTSGEIMKPFRAQATLETK
jgi:predicted dienelactone hydrolase